VGEVKASKGSGKKLPYLWAAFSLHWGESAYAVQQSPLKPLLSVFGSVQVPCLIHSLPLPSKVHQAALYLSNAKQKTSSHLRNTARMPALMSQTVVTLNPKPAHIKETGCCLRKGAQVEGKP